MIDEELKALDRSEAFGDRVIRIVQSWDFMKGVPFWRIQYTQPLSPMASLDLYGRQAALAAYDRLKIKMLAAVLTGNWPTREDVWND